MTTYTITCGEVAENGVRMQQLGDKYEHGFSIDELIKAKRILRDNGYQVQLINLNKYCDPDVEAEPAALLLIKNGVTISGYEADELFEEQEGLIYDTRKFNWGRVTNSIARHNICFADFEQAPDIDNGKGTVVSFDNVPCLKAYREALPTYFGDKANELYGEGNKYYDVKKCGIGYHGDTERRIVIGLRLGEPMDLSYIWFQMSKPIGSRAMITLESGDVYVMSDKAVGYDWKKKLKPTLRHSAGCDKYTKIPKSK